MTQDSGNLHLSIRQVQAAEGLVEGTMRVLIETNRGDIKGLFFPVEGGTTAAIFVGGAAGDLTAAAESGNGYIGQVPLQLRAAGISTLVIAYREGDNFEEAVLDAMASCSFLKGIGAESVVLIGHSMGGAVAIRAGQLAPIVKAVVGLASQRHGTQEVQNLGRPLLLVHGGTDTVLDMAASEDIYERAVDPRRLVLYAETGHTLAQAEPNLVRLLSEWIPARLADQPMESGRTEEWPDGIDPPSA